MSDHAPHSLCSRSPRPASIRKTLLFFVLTVATSSSGALAAAPEIDAKVKAILGKMTLEEKVGQLTFLRFNFDNVEELAREGRLSGLLNVRDHEKREELDRLARQSRLGIPLLHCGDVIHGYRTSFPIPLGLASSWDLELVEKASRVAAKEATAAAGIRLNFSPMVDLTRDPRWGRIAESFGEDAYLSGEMGASMVRGYQGDDLANPDSMVACAKHLGGYGASEGGRDYNTSDVSAQRMYNYHLRPFHTVVKAGAGAIMPAFSSLNGVPVSANPWILRDVLRDSWGFEGITISDAKAVDQLVPHGFARDDAHAAALALNGGMDAEIIGNVYLDHLGDLVRSGDVPMEVLDEAVSRVLRLKLRLDLFAEPPKRSEEGLLTPEALQLARKVAGRSTVLLKNEQGILPLSDEVGKVAVIGSIADNPKEQLGTWAVYSRPQDSVTPLAAITERLGEDRVEYVEMGKHTRDESTEQIPAAVAAANRADLILLFAGEDGIWTGEAKSRSSLILPGSQRELFHALKETGKPIIVVLMTGRPLEIGDLVKGADAILLAWHGGTLAGPGIADNLFGDVNPSGKLPLTWPRVTGQIPIHYDHENTGRPSRDPNLPATNLDQIDTAHVTGYIDAPGSPEFPFGFGLSYTQFEYSDAALESDSVSPDGTIRASATVRNTGDVAGEEVVQLYSRQIVGSLTRPIRELRGFQRVSLQPGESKEVEFELPASALAFYGPDGDLRLEPGKFQLWIIPDAASGTPAEFELSTNR